jgi:hypothetical protein
MDIIQQVEELIIQDELQNKSRQRDRIYKRSYLYAILREEGWNLSQIGRLFNRNHATVINGLKSYDNYYGKDKIYDRYVKHYDSIFKPSIEEVMVSKDAIFQDIMNCYNTTELRFIKERIVSGWYESVKM